MFMRSILVYIHFEIMCTLVSGTRQQPDGKRYDSKKIRYALILDISSSLSCTLGSTKG